MGLITTYGDPDKPAFEARPQGWYDVEITAASLGTSKGSGSAQVEIKLKVIAEDQGRIAPGTEMTHFQNLGEKGVSFLAKFLDAAGVRYERTNVNGAVGISWDPDHLLGKRMRGQLTHRVWNGKPRENWENWCVSKYAQAGGVPQGYQQPQAPAPMPGAPFQGYAPGGPAPGQGYPGAPAMPPQGYQQPPAGYPQQPGFPPAGAQAPGFPPAGFAPGQGYPPAGGPGSGR